METYIKYKRFEEEMTDEKLQEFFDKFIADGWQIIYYKERRKSGFSNVLSFIIIAGKTPTLQKNVL